MVDRPKPARGVAGGEVRVRGNGDQAKANPVVVFLGLGVVGLGFPRGAVAPAAEEDGGGGAPVRRRGEDGAREIERLQAHQKVPEIGVGVTRSGLSAAARARRRRVVAVGSGPVRDWRGERVGELRGVEAKLDVGSI